MSRVFDLYVVFLRYYHIIIDNGTQIVNVIVFNPGLNYIQDLSCMQRVLMLQQLTTR